MTKLKYVVMVDDNFHYMDESERYKAGEFAKFDEAVEKCKAIVDDYLLSAIEPNVTAEQLFTSYTMFGEDPFILGTATYSYSSWDYAKERCSILIKR